MINLITHQLPLGCSHEVTFVVISFAILLGAAPVSADVVYVDFSPSNTTAATGTDFYNTTANQTGDNAATALATGGTISANNLTDIDGTTATSIDISLTSYNDGNGQLRSNNGFSHNPVPGIETFASADGYWMNNHNSNGNGAGNEFGFVLTFSNLDVTQMYDLMVLGNTTNAAGSWSVTSGTGDSDVLGMTGSSDIFKWTDVTPDAAGNITITSSTTPSTTFRNIGIQFASITAVPEPGSASFIVLALIGLVARRKRP